MYETFDVLKVYIYLKNSDIYKVSDFLKFLKFLLEFLNFLRFQQVSEISDVADVTKVLFEMSNGIIAQCYLKNLIGLMMSEIYWVSNYLMFLRWFKYLGVRVFEMSGSI